MRTTKANRSSCWTVDHWPRHCEGYRVFSAKGPIGYVEAVVADDTGDAESLLVRLGTQFTPMLEVPIDAVTFFDSLAERVVVDERAIGSRGDRQLRLTALA